MKRFPYSTCLSYALLLLCFAAIGRPLIISFTYDRGTNTLLCLSTGGPATLLLWAKDDKVLSSDGVNYEESQIVLDTGVATYSNKLTILQRNDVYGLYECFVVNTKGIATRQVRVSGERELGGCIRLRIEIKDETY